MVNTGKINWLVIIRECKHRGLIKIWENENPSVCKGNKERDLKEIGETNSLGYSEECHGDGQRVHMGSEEDTSGCFISKCVTHLFVSSGYGLLIDFCDPG